MRHGHLPRRHGALLIVMVGIVGVFFHACQEATTSVGPSGPVETGPRAGQYVVGEFFFHDRCLERAFSLSGSRATARTAVFELSPATDSEGSVALTGSFAVMDPTPGASGIPIFEGPDTGSYRIEADTLRLRFGNLLNAWVGIIPFTLYRGGVLAGGSDTHCSSLVLRLERRP